MIRGKLLFKFNRNLNTALSNNESPSNYETKCMSPTTYEDGFIFGSDEGKIIVEYFSKENNISNEDSYGFKCHREEFDDKILVYPVNSVISHPV